MARTMLHMLVGLLVGCLAGVAGAEPQAFGRHGDGDDRHGRQQALESQLRREQDAINSLENEIARRRFIFVDSWEMDRAAAAVAYERQQLAQAEADSDAARARLNDLYARAGALVRPEDVDAADAEAKRRIALANAAIDRALDALEKRADYRAAAVAERDLAASLLYMLWVNPFDLHGAMATLQLWLDAIDRVEGIRRDAVEGDPQVIAARRDADAAVANQRLLAQRLADQAPLVQAISMTQNRLADAEARRGAAVLGVRNADAALCQLQDFAAARAAEVEGLRVQINGHERRAWAIAQELNRFRDRDDRGRGDDHANRDEEWNRRDAEARRQKEQEDMKRREEQAKADEQRKAVERQKKVEEDRRRQEELAEIETKRLRTAEEQRQWVLRQQQESEKKQRDEAARKAEDRRRQQELASRDADQRRQKEAEARKAEEARKSAVEQQRKAEEARKAEGARRAAAEQQRKAEDERKGRDEQAKVEALRLRTAEEQRQWVLRQKQEDDRRRQEDSARKAEDQRRQEEARKQQENEQRQQAEAARKAEDQRRQKEAEPPKVEPPRGNWGAKPSVGPRR